MTDKSKNDYYRSQGLKMEAEARQYESKHAANEEKIRRLQDARTKLETAITDYDTFKKNTEKIESDIADSEFQGDIRNKFKTAADTTAGAMNGDINAHQGNLASIDGKIAALELEQGDLFSAAKNAWNAAANFFKSII